MMRLHHLTENFDLARLALKHFSHEEETLNETLPHFRISANAVYPYRNQGKLCFLRLAPADEKEPGLIEAEIQFIQALRSQGFPAMRPLPARDGRYVLPLSTPYGTYTASAVEGVDGNPVEEIRCTPVILYAMGRTLGQMHILSSSIKVARPDHRDIMQEIHRLLLDNKAPSVLLQIWQHTSQALDRLPVSTHTYGLLHYDFEPDNVFWDAKTQTCNVIDFDDALYGWLAMDVEQALQALAETAGEEGCASFLEGYKSVHPFTSAMEAQRPLMRTFINLRSYARLLHCLNDDVTDMPLWMPGLIEKLTSMKKRLETELTATLFSNT